MLENWLNQATSPGGILAFVLGIISAIVYHGLLKPWWCNKHGHHLSYKISIKLTNVIMAIAALAIMWTGVRYTELASEVARCQTEFNTALRVRGEITQDNDRLSLIQREALANWIHDLIFPPPPYDKMDVTDRNRQAWATFRTVEADRTIRHAQEEQQQNDKERSEHPYPDPTCGRVT